MEFSFKGLQTLFVLGSLLLIIAYGNCEENPDSLRQPGYNIADPDTQSILDFVQVDLPVSPDASKFITNTHRNAYETPTEVVYPQDFTYDVQQEQEKDIQNIEGSSNAEMEAPMDNMKPEINEPKVKRKEASCLGCPVNVDMNDPENIKLIQTYMATPLLVMDVYSSSPYKLATPKILSVVKQVENAIKYTVTFEAQISWCPNNPYDPKPREECSPQLNEEKKICAVDLIDNRSGALFMTSNNCTDHVDRIMTGRDQRDEGIVSSGDPATFSYVTGDKSDYVSKNDQKYFGSSKSDDTRMQRSVNVGALRDVDKSELGLVQQFAELAVRTLDEIDPDNTKQIVLGITEAKKQIVNGVMYHLVLQVGSSTCSENESNEGESTNCVENQLYPEKICRVQIHRSWADESPLNAKVVKSECADVWHSEAPYDALPLKRNRRSNQENWPSTDGWQKYDLQDRSQGDCMDKVMTSFQDVLNVSDVSKVATIKDAHTRVNKETAQPEMVVTILLTDAEKLRMMGDIKKPMVVSSRVVCSQRLKRSPGIPGGLTDADVNDPQVIEMTNFALGEIQKSVNSPYRHSVVRIIKASRQVVAGTLFHFELEVAPTSCLKSDQSTTSCSPSTSEGRLICTLKVWDQPWTKKREVQDLNCGASRSKREAEQLLGGPQHIDVEDPYVKELASFALAEIDRGLQSPYQQKVVRVVEAKTQVVAGTLMHMKLELATTNCLKSEKVSSENCVYGSDQATTMCSLKVWDRSWLKKRELQDLQCGRTRSKRHMLSAVDVNDPYIIDLANFAVAELDKGTNSPFRQKLLNVLSAKIEHMWDTNVELNLEVGYSKCKKTSDSNDCDLLEGSEKKRCSVEMKHLPFLQVREITKLKCTQSEPGQYSHSHFLIGDDEVDITAAHFREFRQKFNKTYSTDAELKKRFRIFKDNLKLIEQLQAGEQGTARYEPTIFADLSPKEFKSKYLGLRRDLKQDNAIPMRMAKIPNIQLPTSFDWRDHNAVTPVKNQGACGSCWAFAVTGNLEGQYAIKHGKLLSLSEQELVDCDTLDDGCKGGLPENAYHALEQLGGIETESDYPYEGDDEQCHFNRSEAMVQVKGSVNITTNELDMAKWLVKNGPIAIGINANAMQFYAGGVSHPFKFLCSPGDLDHGVLIVGFGVHKYPMFKKVLPFWIIKNSWGERWGEQGYYRIYRGDGTCGVNQMASSAVVN